MLQIARLPPTQGMNAINPSPKGDGNPIASQAPVESSPMRSTVMNWPFIECGPARGWAKQPCVGLLGPLLHNTRARPCSGRAPAAWSRAGEPASQKPENLMDMGTVGAPNALVSWD